MAPRFEELIERHHDEIFSYVWRLLGTHRRSTAGEDADDLVQETFLRAYRAYPRLRRDSNHRAWLYKIASNCTLTHLGRLKRRRDEAHSLAEHLGRAGDGDHPVLSCKPSRLAAELGRLPAKQKACVTLRYFQDLGYAEIAAAMDCSEQTARANVYQAIRRLRAALEAKR